MKTLTSCIVYIFLGYALFELLKILLAYPFGMLSARLGWADDDAMLLDSALSAVTAGAVALSLFLRWKRKNSKSMGKNPPAKT
jgi:hypothetical protein